MAQRNVPFSENLLLKSWPEQRLHYAQFVFNRNQHRKAAHIAAGVQPTNERQQLQVERMRACGQVIEGTFNWPISDIVKPTGSVSPSVLIALHNSAPYDFAGYWYRTKNILQCLTNAGLRLHCATRPGYPWDLQKHRTLPVSLIDKVDGVEFFRLSSEIAPYKQGSDFRYISNYAVQLAELAKQNNSNVIHGHSNYLNGLAAIEASRITGCLSVYEARGFWHLTRLSKEPEFGDTDAFVYEVNMEKLALQHADQVVTLSGAMKELIVSFGVNADKVHVVPNAVDTNRFVPEKTDLLLRQQWPVDGFVVGFIGSLTPYEGLLDLVSAVKILRKQGVRVSLVVVGSGPFEPNLNEAIKGCDFIYFPGRIPHEDVNRWYATFDCCAYPRKNDPVCRYVPPLKVLEAMAMEKPVIVSDLPPLLEMVQNGVTGLLCAPDSPESLANKIKLLMDDEELAKQLGQEARRWVKANRTWEINAKKYMDVYQGRTAL